jgi:hypothetical protein
LNSDSKVKKVKNIYDESTNYLVYPDATDWLPFEEDYNYKNILLSNMTEVFIVPGSDILKIINEFVERTSKVWILPDKFNIDEFEKDINKDYKYIYDLKEYLDKNYTVFYENNKCLY